MKLSLHAHHLSALCLAGFAAALFSSAPARAQSSGNIVQDAKNTSVFDAFLTINRLGDDPKKEEPKIWAGRMLNRIENMTARQIIKLPTAMSKDAFEGWRIFMRTELPERRGNCVACHTPPNYTDGMTHNIGFGEAKHETPSLRRLDSDAPYMNNGDYKTIEAAVAAIAEKAGHAAMGHMPGVDEEFANIRIGKDDVAPLVAFLKSLKSVDKTRFREYLLNHELYVPVQDE